MPNIGERLLYLLAMTGHDISNDIEEHVADECVDIKDEGAHDSHQTCIMSHITLSDLSRAYKIYFIIFSYASAHKLWLIMYNGHYNILFLRYPYDSGSDGGAVMNDKK
uniref:Uncharacterized protein n=1 Tax=Glossina pallidipes TaxID=7398 RepID=A0A1A9ZEH9_GLOPL